MAAGPDRKVMFIKSHMDVLQEADTTPLHKQTGVYLTNHTHTFNVANTVP